MAAAASSENAQFTRSFWGRCSGVLQLHGKRLQHEQDDRAEKEYSCHAAASSRMIFPALMLRRGVSPRRLRQNVPPQRGIFVPRAARCVRQYATALCRAAGQQVDDRRGHQLGGRQIGERFIGDGKVPAVRRAGKAAHRRLDNGQQVGHVAHIRAAAEGQTAFHGKPGCANRDVGREQFGKRRVLRQRQITRHIVDLHPRAHGVSGAPAARFTLALAVRMACTLAART